ncbi:MarR family winged helix-turn-helix transcriptional regulator [Actinomadura macra]|uniref:MarR family winged helix-turn-helix transcriptional regulator n=1 Tax=Actinomadura macra TaxID=46164 RepID=UPI00082C8D7E|nr:MarR family transcriptional regulator [Actinomadura macra]
MRTAGETPVEHDLVEEIVGRLARRYSTATVLLHQAAAERLGLGPADHKCLDLLRERGPMTGSRLAVLTGLTSGAITGVVARLEQAGYLRREPDPHDGRKQILHPVPDRIEDLSAVFIPLRRDIAALLEDFDVPQLTAIAQFLARAADHSLRHAALLRADTRSGAPLET